MVKKAGKAVKQANKGDDTKFWAFLAVFLNILGFIIVLLAKKENKYVMFYAKQSLILFIAAVIISVAGMIPILGWFIIMPLGTILLIILWIIGIVYSLSGEQKQIPFIGKFADKINL